ncbi:MAG TPA: GTP-binding protein [Anaerohalosphaeraceae bacterium]|nr:GTP-binding protein [Anaerohalosphaeraceae bacterium]
MDVQAAEKRISPPSGFEREQTWACIRTGAGTAAIGTVEIEGPEALNAVRRIFLPFRPDVEWKVGRILHGRFLADSRVLDEGLAAMEAENRLALHAHGNPLILRQIVKTLQNTGVPIVRFEQMLRRRFQSACCSFIEAEARLEMLRAASFLGVQCLHHQITGGLTEVLRRWINRPEIQSIPSEAEAILQHSRIARRILQGVRIVIAGPPNSGKSTLLNRLAGQERAIVSDIPGTTRDWVTAFGRLGPLWVEWVDTAGLDEELARADTLEQIAQQRTRERLTGCDLILYVLDTSVPLWTRQLPTSGLVPTLTVLNKYDLSKVFPSNEQNAVAVSALHGTNIEQLYERILQILQIDSFDPARPAAFTDRQIQLLQKIVSANDPDGIKTLIQQLFKAPQTV